VDTRQARTFGIQRRRLMDLLQGAGQTAHVASARGGGRPDVRVRDVHARNEPARWSKVRARARSESARGKGREARVRRVGAGVRAGAKGKAARGPSDPGTGDARGGECDALIRGHVRVRACVPSSRRRGRGEVGQTTHDASHASPVWPRDICARRRWEDIHRCGKTYSSTETRTRW
jgi:hypothetical protein